MAIDGRAWGEWVSAGARRWDVVRRSRSIFTRNTTELMDLLNGPATDPRVAARLMVDDGAGSAPFWEELDQRLHNQLSSAASLIDHERRLIRYYAPDFPAVDAEYQRRVATIVAMNEEAFLGDLRNYLLHYGAAPLIQTLNLRPTEPGTTGHLVKLSAVRLLEWRKWTAPARGYLESFGDNDGPVLGRDVVAYANAVSALATWIFEQHPLVNSGENVPDRFRMPGV